jgi:site-specific recombinase XerD
MLVVLSRTTADAPGGHTRPDVPMGMQTGIQWALKATARQAGMPTRVSPHTLRHTCATLLLQAHDDIRQIQQMLGHSDVRTTMIDTHTLTSDLKP